MGITKKLGHMTLSLGLLTMIAGAAQTAPPTGKSGTNQNKTGTSNTQSSSGQSGTSSSTQQQQQQQQSNHELVQALKELHAIEKNLAGDDHDYGGHRVAAMHDIHEAEHQIREALKDAHHEQKQSGGKQAGHSSGKQGGNAGNHTSPGNGKSEPLPQRASNQQLGNDVTALQQVVSTLRQAKHDYGGHREKAVQDLEKAIHQLQVGLQYAKEYDRKNG